MLQKTCATLTLFKEALFIIQPFLPLFAPCWHCAVCCDDEKFWVWQFGVTKTRINQIHTFWYEFRYNTVKKFVPKNDNKVLRVELICFDFS